MFNIKKVQRLEKELQEAREINDNVNLNRFSLMMQVDELKREIDRLGLYRDSKGRFQSIDTQL